MTNFETAAESLGIVLDEVLELLGLTESEAKLEVLTVDEIVEACYDSGLFGDDDWESDSFAGTYGY